MSLNQLRKYKAGSHKTHHTHVPSVQQQKPCSTASEVGSVHEEGQENLGVTSVTTPRNVNIVMFCATAILNE